MGRTTAGGQGSQPARKNTGSARLTPSFLARKASAEHEKAQVGGTKSELTSSTKLVDYVRDTFDKNM